MPYPFTSKTILDSAGLDAEFQTKLDLNTTAQQAVSGPLKMSGQYIVLPVGSSHPANPVTGMLYLDSALGIQLYDGTKWVTIATAPAVVPVVPPGAFTLSGSTPGVTTAALSWTAAGGDAPVSYQPRQRPHGTSGWTNSGAATTALSATLTGLTANTSYDFSVLASNAGGSSTSNTITELTASVPPGALTVTVGAITSTSVAITWSTPAGTQPISYTPQYKTASGSWTALPVTTSTGATFTGLQQSTAYSIDVVASNAGGSSTSPTVTATTVSASVAPNAPGVTIGAITPNTIALSWTAPTVGTAPFSYSVAYGPSGQPQTTVAEAGTSATLDGLTPATKYTVSVIAANAAGSAASTPATVTTSAAAQAAVGTVTGSQTAGASPGPTITAPVSGTVYATQSLAIGGIAVDDNYADLQGGTGQTLTVTATAGTVTMTSGGSPVSGSGTASVTLSGTMAALTAAAPTLVYTAGSSTGTPSLTITITDWQARTVHAIVELVVLAQATESPSGTAVNTVGPSITDAQGNVWTIDSNALIDVNGVPDTTTANVVELYYKNHIIYQKNTAGLWYSKTSATATWVDATDPTVAPQVGSLDGARTTQGGPAITDSNGTTYTIDANGQIDINGAVDTTSWDVTAVYWLSGGIFQVNGSGLWYQNTAGMGAWVAASNQLPQSADKTEVTAIGTRVVDAAMNSYELASGGKVNCNGALSGSNANRILYYGGAIYYETTSSTYFLSNSPGVWTAFSGDPRATTGGTGGGTTQPGTRFPYQTATKPGWPFAANSFYNIGLGSGAKWSAAGDALTNALGLGAPTINLPDGGWDYPTYTGNAGDQVLVSSAGGGWFDQQYNFSVHVPANAVQSSQSDQLLCLFDATQPLYAEWNNNCVIDRNAGTIYGGYVSRWDSQGNGVAATGQGNSLPGIQGQELDQGFINHVLPCSMLDNQLRAWDPNNTQFGTNHFNCVWPAKGSDYFANGVMYNGVIPFGSIIGIPKSVVDVETLGLTGGALIMARQLQNYGWLVSNRSGTFTTYASWDVTSTTARTNTINQMKNSLSTLAKYMRVMLSWMVGMANLQTPTTAPGPGYQYDPIQNPNAPINGGGTYPPPPPPWDPSLPSGFSK